MTTNRDDIIRAAIHILDSYGLADMSMRRIASALDVKAATIYWYFENKQSLLAGVSDTIICEVKPTDNLRGWAYALRTALLAHRDGAEVVAATMAVDLGEQSPAQQVVAILRDEGCSDINASRYASVLVHFILGHVMHEQTRQNLIDFNVIPATQQAIDDAGFETGIDLILTGLSSTLASH